MCEIRPYDQRGGWICQAIEWATDPNGPQCGKPAEIMVTDCQNITAAFCREHGERFRAERHAFLVAWGTHDR